MKTISLRLSQEDLEVLEKASQILEVPRSWIIRKLIRSCLEDLIDGELAKRRLINPQWVDQEDVEKAVLEDQVGEKSPQRP